MTIVHIAIRYGVSPHQRSLISLSEPASGAIRHLRNGQPQIFAQGRAGKILTEQAAALQLRHHEADEILVGAGHVGADTTKPSQARSTNHCSSRSATSFGPPTIGVVHPAAAADNG